METFNEIINGDKLVLVDFFATWCGPCKAMTPVIESIGKELQGKIRVLKVDIDKNQVVANKFQIRGVPTFVIFKKGKAVWRNSGVMDKSVLLQQLQNYL